MVPGLPLAKDQYTRSRYAQGNGASYVVCQTFTGFMCTLLFVRNQIVIGRALWLLHYYMYQVARTLLQQSFR